jgi:hypothetical protein
VKRWSALGALVVALTFGAGAAPGYALTHQVGPRPPAAAAASGTVAGRFFVQGGPMKPGGHEPRRHPVPGTIQFRTAHRPAVVVKVGRSGRFSARLAPGRYTATARTPRIVEITPGGKHRETPCAPPRHLTVRAHHRTHLVITCYVP